MIFEQNKKLQKIADNHSRICHLAKPKKMKIKYKSDKSKQQVTGDFFCNQKYEGYPGIMHGAIISAIFDTAMGNCLFASDITAVTVELTTRFRLPIETNENATVVARIKKTAGPLYFLEAKITQNEKVKATAKAKFYDQPKLKHVLENKKSKKKI